MPLLICFLLVLQSLSPAACAWDTTPVASPPEGAGAPCAHTVSTAEIADVSMSRLPADHDDGGGMDCCGPACALHCGASLPLAFVHAKVAVSGYLRAEPVPVALAGTLPVPLLRPPIAPGV